MKHKQHDSTSQAVSQLEHDGMYALLKAGFKRKPEAGKLPSDETGTIKNLATILSVVNQYWITGGIVVMLALIAGGLSYPIPLVVRNFIDKILIPQSNRYFLNSLVPLLSLYAGQTLVIMLMNHCSQLFEQRTLFDLRNYLTRCVLGCPKSFFDQLGNGYITSRLNNDITHVSWFFSHAAAHLLVDFIKMLGGVIFLFYIDFRVAILSIIFLPGFLFFAMKISRQQYILSLNREEQCSLQNENSAESIANIRFLKSATGEYPEVSKNSHFLQNIYSINLESLSLESFSRILGEGMPFIAHFILLMISSWWWIHGDKLWTPGTLIAAQIYLWYVFCPIRALSRDSVAIQNARAALLRVKSLLSISSEPNLNSGQPVNTLRGHIIFENVAFQYQPNHLLLKQVSFNIIAGEKIALVGLSGSGKTTVASLIMGFYRPTRGQICFDGVPAETFNRSKLRRCMGYIPQEPQLFNGSILDIMSYSAPRFKAEKIEAALDRVGLKHFFALLPEGINTKLVKPNTTLSPSLRQRLIFARYLLSNPDVLIIDSLTDNLDAFNESKIMQCIRTDFNSKTVVMITNKYSTAMQADKVLLLHQGKIVGFDKPDKLAKTSSLFARIFNID